MKKFQIPVLVAITCIIMAIVDAVIQPGYAVKSLIKIILFLLIPVFYGLFNKEVNIKKLIKPNKSGIVTAISLGAAVYVIILGSYFVFRNVFDFSALTTSLGETTGVNKSNFIWVAIYISFINSLLEEFFFPFPVYFQGELLHILDVFLMRSWGRVRLTSSSYSASRLRN